MPRASNGNISDVFGVLYDFNQPEVTIEEMNETIARGWAGKI